MSAPSQRLSPQITFQGRTTRCWGEDWGGRRQHSAENVHGLALRVAPGACAAASPCTGPPIPPVPTDLPNYKGNIQQLHRGETSPSPSTFISRGCRDQRPHTGATGADPAGSLRSRCGQGLAPSAAPGEGPSCLFQFLGAPGGLGLWPCYSSLRFLLRTAVSSCVSVQISLLLEDTSHCI